MSGSRNCPAVDSTAARVMIATGCWMPSTFSSTTTLFGIGISFQSNHPGALSCALSAFPQDGCRVSSGERPVRIDLVADAESVPAADSSRIIGRRLEIVERGIAVSAGGERGRGTCIFHPQAVGSEAFANAINTVALFLVAQRDRIPLHASAIIVHDRALILAGRSGAGKSALALAADRAGLPILSDDTVFLQLQPTFCVWGRPLFVHLSEMDAPAGTSGGIRIRSGRVKRAIPIVHQCRRADRAALFLLTKGDRVVFQRLDPEDAVRVLTRDPEPGYEFYGARLEEAVRVIAASGCWRLTLSTNADDAIGALVRAFSPVVAPAAALDRWE